MRFLKIRAILFFSLMLFVISRISAQAFSVSVPKKNVAVGETFLISFNITVNTDNFSPPSFKDFVVQGGPNQSQNMQIINGNISQSMSISYYLAATKEGKYTIGAASITSGGKKLTTQPVVIEVSGKAAQPNGNAREQAPSVDKIDDENLFVRISTNKSKAYVGEEIFATIKVYTRVDLRNFQKMDLPVYPGFWASDIDPKNKQLSLKEESYNGKIYNVCELKRVILFPQRAGKLEISPAEIECLVMQKVRSNDPLEDFFGMSRAREVIIPCKSNALKLEIMELPQPKPTDFTGAVGNFTIKTEVDKQNLKANEAINLKVTLNGAGNIKLIEAPKMSLPDGFETFDPKTTENISISEGGVKGSKTINYLIIPRREGDFNLENIKFSYFDIATKKYVSLPSPNLTIHVDKGDPNAAPVVINEVEKQDVKQMDKELRSCKSNLGTLSKNNNTFFGSWLHWLFMFSIPIIGAAFMYNYKKNQLTNADIGSVNQRKAAKLAKQQLKIAEQKMLSNDKEAFYAEIHQALNNYLSKKTKLATSELSKESLSQMLMDRNLPNELVSKAIKQLEDCEFARYAPASLSDDLKQVYTSTAELISNLENCKWV